MLVRCLFPLVLLAVTVVLLMLTTTLLAYTPSIYLEIKPIYPIKYANLISIVVYGKLEDKAEAQVAVSFSDGIELLRGNVNTTGVFNNVHTTVCCETLMVKINKPGIYEISATLNATKLNEPLFAKFLPDHRSIFLYTREDTVVCFDNRTIMERAIRDSLIVPRAVLETRRKNRRLEISDSIFWAERAKKKNPPMITCESLERFVFAARILSDSIRLSQYNPGQLNLIAQNHLLFSPPLLDRVEMALNQDLRNSLSPEQLSSLTQIVKRQIIELYQLDIRIIRSDESSLRARLLSDRNTLTSQQTEERNLAITTK